MAWIPLAESVLSIVLRYVIPIILGGTAIWWLWSSASAVQTGVQQAAPGIGAAVGSVGMMFSLLPVMMMFMMMMSMFTMMLRLVE